MKDNLSQTSWQDMKWLRFGLIIVLILGILFRFVNIDKRPYWLDETHTSMRAAGYTSKEVNNTLYTAGVVGQLELQKYFRIDSERGVIDTVKALAVQEPQHPPLYYVMARMWAQCFGDSVAAIRSLSAVISLLAFPSIYWLCRELFNLPLVGWLAMGLIAVSPFHVFYAQEARQYSLWTVTILLSSAALLRATRTRTKLSWGFYGIALALGLYTFPFTIFVATGHAIYVLASEKFRLTKTSIAYLVASLGAIIAFSPWLWVIIAGWDKVDRTTSWVKKQIDVLFFGEKLVENISQVFIDFNWNFNIFHESKPIYFIPYWVLTVPSILILIGYSLYYLWRRNKKNWLFIFTLMTVTTLVLLITDLTLGGVRSLVYRYVTPCYLAIHLSVAYLLATNITSSDGNNKRLIWRLLTVVLISSGIFSCAVSSQAEFWYIKGADYRPLAAIVNQADKPLLISDSGSNRLMALSYLLDPKVRIQLVDKSNIPNISLNGFSDVFLYRPSKKLILGLEQQQNYNLEEITNNKNSETLIILRLKK